MRPIIPLMAKAISDLLATIKANTDEHPDWIDAVCSAYEKLPQGTREALQGVADVERQAMIFTRGNTNET